VGGRKNRPCGKKEDVDWWCAERVREAKNSAVSGKFGLWDGGATGQSCGEKKR